MKLRFLVAALPLLGVLRSAGETAERGRRERKTRRFQVLLGFSVLCVAFAMMVSPVLCQNDLYDVLSEVFSSPMTLLIFSIQFGLGLGLGYFSVKALKYIIAIVCILALGVMLNIWQFGGLENFLGRLGIPVDPTQLTSILTAIVGLLGILTILPMGVGFLLGAIAAAIK